MEVEEDDQDKNQQEITFLQDFIDEVKKKNHWKSEMRSENLNLELRPEESDLHKLDSSLKKNNGFIRKLKNFTDSQKDVIKKEMASLNLSKYIGEVCSAIVEAKLKMTDLPAFLDICSFLHQRYSEMSSHLLECFQKSLAIKKEEKISNPSKFRVDLRFFAELVSCGVFTLREGLPLLGQVLTMIVAIDKEEHSNLALITAFCKHCGDDYAGLLPKRVRILADKHRYQVPQSDFLPEDKKKGLRQMLRDYYSSLGKHLVSEFKELQNVERTNRRILLTKGEVHKERLERAEELQINYKRLMSSCEQLADLLDEDMPEMEDNAKSTDEADLEDAEMDNIEVEVSALGALWEDEETKSFYEGLVDLKAFIPAILYKESAQQSGLVEDNIELDEQADFEDEAVVGVLEKDGEVVPPDMDDDTEDTSNQSTSNKMLLDAFLAKLPTCVSRDMIDNVAAEFCMSLNTKNNRKKLVKNLFAVHRNRQDLLPFYCRLVATLYPCMPEIAVDLSAYLKQEFRWQLRKKDQMKIESKLKVCRFIGEMVKFKMFPKSEALFCVKMLLFDFSHHHIEMACTLMETCGQFMYRLPESHQRTKVYLEQMMRKKTALSMDSRYSMMIENAYFNVNPPETTTEAKQKLPAWQEYIHKLLYADLSKNTTEKVLRQIRKLNWNDKEVSEYTVACLAAIYNVKYYNVRCSASLLAGLVSYHEWVGPRIVDAVLEDVRLMMEINDVKYNQRRISVVKFLAELYNYRLVDSSVVFKVLYSLISFGASLYPDEPNPFDPPDHTLRIRLVCVVLETCGVYFSSGSTKKKLDFFITYFQRYFWRKKECSMWRKDEEPMFPVTISNVLAETLMTLRPKLKLFKSLKESEEAIEKIEREVLKTLQEKAPELAPYLMKNQDTNHTKSLIAINEEEEEEEQPKEEGFGEFIEDEDSHDDDNDEEEEEEEGSNSRSRSVSQMAHEEDNSQEDLSQQFDLSQENESFDECEVTSSSAVPKLLKCEEDSDFQAMFDKMLNENITESKSSAPRPQQATLVAPVQVKLNKKNADPVQSGSEDTVPFTVLLRKGNKPVYREIAVPVHSEIAQNLQRQEEADRLEKERVKKLTLEINDRQEEEEVIEAIAAMQRPGLVFNSKSRDNKTGANQQRDNKTGANQQQQRTNNHNKGAPDADSIFGGPPKRHHPK